VKVILKKNAVSIDSFTVNNLNNSFYDSDIKFNFDSASQYSFCVQTNTVNDTIYQYTISQYIHNFKSAYTYQKILSLKQSLGPNYFDITPSRNYIYLIDDSLNTLVTKRISLKNYSVDNFGKALSYAPIRAISDDELLTQNSYYNSRYLIGDSSALVKYNILNGKTTFVDWTSNSYGRTSRIINNKVLVTNPVDASNFFSLKNTNSLINLIDTSKIVYANGTIDFRYIRENNFDKIYYGNQSINEITGAFTNLLPTNSNDFVEYFDSIYNYKIATNYTFNSTHTGYYSSFTIYQNQDVIFKSDTLLYRSIYIPKIQSIKNNSILIYQYFGYGSTFNFDGYYLLDLNTKKLSLIQCDNSSASIVTDFQLDDAHLFTIRYDGIYWLKKN
jgi:hypothetical protein